MPPIQAIPAHAPSPVNMYGAPAPQTYGGVPAFSPGMQGAGIHTQITAAQASSYDPFSAFAEIEKENK